MDFVLFRHVHIRLNKAKKRCTLRFSRDILFTVSYFSVTIWSVVVAVDHRVRRAVILQLVSQGKRNLPGKVKSARENGD